MLIQKCTKAPSKSFFFFLGANHRKKFCTATPYVDDSDTADSNCKPTIHWFIIHPEDFEFMITMINPLTLFSFLNMLSIHNCVTTRYVEPIILKEREKKIICKYPNSTTENSTMSRICRRGHVQYSLLNAINAHPIPAISLANAPGLSPNTTSRTLKQHPPTTFNLENGTVELEDIRALQKWNKSRMIYWTRESLRWSNHPHLNDTLWGSHCTRSASIMEGRYWLLRNYRGVPKDNAKFTYNSFGKRNQTSPIASK